MTGMECTVLSLCSALMKPLWTHSEGMCVVQCASPNSLGGGGGLEQGGRWELDF